VRTREIQNVREVIDLMDRFLFGELNYPFEWDDFISWEHANPLVESIREDISSVEPLYFSQQLADREKAKTQLIEKRNELAASYGMSSR